ncbi:MAG: HipA N-terminal domain-containing protein [Chitinispirillaceae bacterium]|nr:HipA N-terminal domain-containing protein [Chitinispirillaceae bacterium]
MNRAGTVFYNGIKAGRIEQRDGEYIFTYDNSYLADPSLPPISISFAKNRSEYHSAELFPFFFGLLAEGANKQLQCASLKIDENDHFSRLLKTTENTTIGPITVKEEP